MKKLELIIFDMDGVLIDSEKFYMKSEQQIVESFGKEVEIDYFRQFCGTTQDHIWSNIKKDFDLPETLENLKIKAKKQLLHLFDTEEVELIPGITEILPKLKAAGYKLAVASSTEKAIIKEHLTGLNLIQHFDFIKSAEEVAHSKPAPDVFLRTAADLNVPFSQAIVIEDSTNGIQAAKSAEMICVAFNNPIYPPVDQTKADIIIDDMTKLTPDFLKEVFEK